MRLIANNADRVFSKHCQRSYLSSPPQRGLEHHQVDRRDDQDYLERQENARTRVEPFVVGGVC